MADTADFRHDAPARTRDRVVRPLSRAAARPCSRPGCPTPASATLSFRYGTREAWLGSLTEDRVPENYDLCGAHADRTRPPHGWDLIDERPADAGPGTPSVPTTDIGGERTVAVLAAALRSVPTDRPAAPDTLVAGVTASEAVPVPEPAAMDAPETAVLAAPDVAAAVPAELGGPSAPADDGLDDDDLEDVLEELAAFEAEVAVAVQRHDLADRPPDAAVEPHDETLQLAIDAIDELGETGRAERW